jgi:inner membrane protein involved in colicin E2 resistance
MSKFTKLSFEMGKMVFGITSILPAGLLDQLIDESQKIYTSLRKYIINDMRDKATVAAPCCSSNNLISIY